MKRPIDTVKAGAGAAAGTPFDPSMGKKLRQANLLDTPIAGLASLMADTPESGPSSLPMHVPSTTERLLAGFTLDTPVAGVTGVTVQTPSLGKAPQQVPSPAKCQPPSQPQLDLFQFVTPDADLPTSSQPPAHNQQAPPCDQQLTLQARLDLQASASLQSMASGSDVFVLNEQAEAGPSSLAQGLRRLPSGRATHLCDDDFVLSISQSYRRKLESPEGPSYRTPTPVLQSSQDYTGDPSQQSGQQPSGSCCGALSEDAAGCGSAALSELLPCSAALCALLPNAAAGAVDATPPEETRTPELEPVCVVSSQQAEESTATDGDGVEVEVATFRTLAPIFRVKAQRKWLIFVRHGESMYNKLDAEGRSWNDPSVYDAALSRKGMRQALGIRSDLARRIADKADKYGDALWVTSPLSRAIDTMLLACPFQERLGALAKQPLGVAGNGAGSSQGGAVQPLNVVVLSTITEHCATSGDVGRPRSKLQASFPQLAAAEWDVHAEEWWYNPEPQTKPNCALRGVMGRRESKADMQRRVAEFRRWLNARPERLIVAFGHSTFWRHFTNTKSLPNCGIWSSVW